jgi:hypothetical protein
MNTANGACPGSASTITSTSTPTTIPSPTASPAPRSRRGWTARGVEIFHKGERIAVPIRASGNRKHTTVTEHMPSSPRRYAGWTIERIREDARKIGPATAALCEQILESRPHPEQGYRACLGILRLARSFGVARLEAAAERAIGIGARTYGSVKSILDNKLDRKPAPKGPAETAPILHPNIRGGERRLAQASHPRPASRPWSLWNGKGLRRHHHQRTLSHADWLALLLDRETSWRRDKRLTARLRAARLRQQASVEDVDYRAARSRPSTPGMQTTRRRPHPARKYWPR